MEVPSADRMRLAFSAAEEAGIVIEMVEGIPMWELAPGPRHQRELFRIQSSICRDPSQASDCGCVQFSDVYLRFSDGSFKRPDLAIFCREPDEQDEAITIMPEAVIEIVSPGYERKDYAIGLPFYLKSGVKDVVIFNPRAGTVLHTGRNGPRELTSPIEIALECGCRITV